MSNKTDKNFLFTWKIKNYSASLPEFQEKITSPAFFADNFDSVWSLEMFPGGYWDREYISIYLRRDDNYEITSNITIAYEIKFILENKEVIGLFQSECDFLINRVHGKDKAIKIHQLYNALSKCNEDTLIILCHMWETKPSSTRKAIGCVAETKIGVKQCSYLWNVKRNCAARDWIEEEIIDLFEIGLFKVKLNCPEDSILISIQPQDSQNLSNVTCRVTLMDYDGNVKFFQSDIHRFQSEESWTCPTFLSIAQLENEIDIIQKNGAFLLKLNFSKYNQTQYEEIVRYDYELPLSASTIQNESYSTLHDDFYSMLNNKMYCDAQLRVEGQIFHVQKSVLSCRSPVFSAMFERDLLEGQTGVVDIVDMDKICLKSFLTFVYADIVEDMNYELALKLLVISDKYQVMSLKKKCSNYLKPLLNMDNVCEILHISDLVDEKFLKVSAINFVIKNSRKILVSTTWLDLIKRNCELASEVLCLLSTKIGNVC